MSIIIVCKTIFLNNFCGYISCIEKVPTYKTVECLNSYVRVKGGKWPFVVRAKTL